MKSQNSKVKKNADQQLRGSSLREQMVDSEKYGEAFRAKNQGADVVDPSVRHHSEKSKASKK